MLFSLPVASCDWSPAELNAGSLNFQIVPPSKNRHSPRPRYGIFTDDASCKRKITRSAAGMARTASSVGGAPLKISNPPNHGAIVVPSELKACARFNRLEGGWAGRKSATYGLAETVGVCVRGGGT